MTTPPRSFTDIELLTVLRVLVSLELKNTFKRNQMKVSSADL